MATRWTLNMAAMQEEFFSDTALIGISCALQGYRFCWLINRLFDMQFVRQPDLDICMQNGKENETYFSIYEYLVPMGGSRNIIYRLKNKKESLLPEVKQLDYLWLVQSYSPETDAMQIAGSLKTIEDIQLSQILVPEKLKNLNNLLV